MDIHESISHVMQQQELLGKRFYETFFRRCPEAEVYFQDINMERQVHMLTMALLVIEQTHTKSYGATKTYLRYMGSRHHQISIPERLYPIWKDVMLETLETVHGDKWDEGLATEWRESLDAAIALMLEGYETRVIV